MNTEVDMLRSVGYSLCTVLRHHGLFHAGVAEAASVVRPASKWPAKAGAEFPGPGES